MLKNTSSSNVTEIVKRDLIHASNFSTLRMCNLASTGCTALKFGSKTFLSLYQELIIEVRESIQHSIGMCKMSA